MPRAHRRPPVDFAAHVEECLGSLCGELRELEDWPRAQLTASLLLFDVLTALEIGDEAIAHLLGRRALAWIADELGAFTDEGVT